MTSASRSRSTCLPGAAFLALAILLFTPRPARAQDLTQDWSDAQNPNGPWQYDDGISPLPAVTWIWAGYSQPAWAPSNDGGDFLPAWFKATQAFAEFDWQVGDVVVHTTDPFNGPAHGPATVSWTSPSAGSLDIAGGVWMCRDIGRGNRWTLLHNGSPLSSGLIYSGDGFDRSTPFLFSQGSGGPGALSGILVGVGDTISLVIERTSGAGDFVGVRLSICTSADVDATPPMLLCPAVIHAIDEKGGPGTFVSFSVSAVDACDPSPSVVCVPPSGSFFPRGTTMVTCTATDASGNQSMCAFPVVVRPSVRRR